MIRSHLTHLTSKLTSHFSFPATLNSILNLIYPPFCEICHFKLNPDEKYICKSCLKKIRLIHPPFCRHCGRGLSYKRKLCNECSGQKSYLAEVWSWGIYENILKKCIHLLKYKRRLHILYIFKKQLYEFFEQNLIKHKIDIITAVPMHRKKRKLRGFNQAEILAKLFSSDQKLKFVNSLKKTRPTLPQYELTREKRRTNVKGAFMAQNIKEFCGKNVLLVDDIFTTGSTVNECAKILLEKGASKVYAFVLARGL